MPTILTLRLETLADTRLNPATAPARGWFMALLRNVDEHWGTDLHKPNRRHPYTTAPLHRCGKGMLWERAYAGKGVRAGQEWIVQVTVLDDQRADWLCNVLPDANLPTLGQAPVRLLRLPVFTDDDPDIYHRSWESLYGAPPLSRIVLRFDTPTAYRRDEECLPFVNPSRLWNSWADAWTNYWSVKHDGRWVPGEKYRLSAFGENLPEIRRYTLETRDMIFETDSNSGRERRTALFIGFVGTMELTWRKNTPEDVMQSLTALAHLAEFCGTGSKTTIGMGQTRLVVNASEK
jgi:CRISPR-associated endoribonuclease Cas6